jgi:hypothetical protein
LPALKSRLKAIDPLDALRLPEIGQMQIFHDAQDMTLKNPISPAKKSLPKRLPHSQVLLGG